MRFQGRLVGLAYSGLPNATVTLRSDGNVDVTLPVDRSTIDQCEPLRGRMVAWDAYPVVAPVKTEAEWRAEETALLVDSLKARLGAMTAEERAEALARLG